MMYSGGYQRCGQAMAVFLIVLLIGCTRAPEPTFVSSDDATELSELHQKDIQANLKTMFGSPVRPRLLLSLPADSKEEVDAEQAAPEPSSSADDESDSKISVLDTQRLHRGAAVYGKRCAGCHGFSGDGKGPAAEYLQPKPRDYRKGVFKFTSTSYGDRPARQDLVRTIRRGAKGTSMPAFPWMSHEDLDAVIDYVIYLSMRGKVESDIIYNADDYDEDESMDKEDYASTLESEMRRWESAESKIINPISAEPPNDLASVKLGRELFIKSSCFNCHGADAKGQTEWLSPEFLAAQESAPPEEQTQINLDAWGAPAPAANITARMLHGGRRPLDIYRRIYTGINGTPMPQFGPIFTEDPDAIWHMVHYVLHIVEGGDPTVEISVADVQAAVATEKAKEKAAKEAAAAKEKATE